MLTFINISHHSCIRATFLYRKHFISRSVIKTKKLYSDSVRKN